ncbi:MAG: invasion associated locus B family protein [Pseudomonadota bacterium]
MKIVVCFLALLIMPLATSSGAFASEPRLIGTYGDWSAYVFMENGNKVCYMASQPKTAQGNYTKRGEIFALVTHRPAENTKNVFSYTTGYPYKDNSNVDVTIDARKFTLFTQGDTAWTADAASDNQLTNAIKQGNKMVVKGTSTRGTLTTDTFSLKGSTKAHQRISQECS